MMINCKICENSYCRFAKTDDSHIVSCSGYKAPPKPQTAADRFRVMSDEELVDALMTFLVKSVENSDLADLRVEFEDGYRDALLRELRQPVEDGDNDGD